MTDDQDFPKKSYSYKGFRISPLGDAWNGIDPDAGLVVATGSTPSVVERLLDSK